MFGHKKYSVGIDIGNNYIKIVRLVYDENDINIDKYVIQKTPSQLLNNGIIQYPDDLGEIIKSILIENEIKCKRASISVSVGEETAILKWVDVPNLKNKDMSKAIISMIEDELHYEADKIYYNWVKLSEKKSSNQDLAEVLMIGSTKNCIDNIITSLKKCNIKPYYIEADIFSILRAFYPKNKSKIMQNIAFVDIGSIQTKIGIITNNIFSYSRTIPYGGKEWIDKIVNVENLTVKKAETELFKNGIILSKNTINEYKKKISIEEATENNNLTTFSSEEIKLSGLLTDNIDQITDEIKTTIEFFEEYSKNKIDKIIIVGGGGRLKNINNYISDKLNIPCEIGVPFFVNNQTGELKEELIHIWPSILVATGLALKEVYDNV